MIKISLLLVKMAFPCCCNSLYGPAISVQNKVSSVASRNGCIGDLASVDPLPVIESVTKPGCQSAKRLHPVTYTKTKLQRLLRVCMSVKKPFYNKPRSFLKAYFPNLYFKKSHFHCYWFCQQCKNYFKSNRANGNNRNFFATVFLRDGISTY